MVMPLFTCNPHPQMSLFVINFRHPFPITPVTSFLTDPFVKAFWRFSYFSAMFFCCLSHSRGLEVQFVACLIVKTIFVCVDEAIVAKTNKSVKTVYNLCMINTIWTYTLESFVIRLSFFSFTFPWVAIFCS